MTASVRYLVRAVVCVLVAALAGACAVRARSSGTSNQTASVIRVIDGDTVDVRLNGHRERVRLLGIDTPETVDPSKPVQCYGHEASARTAALLPVGTRVRLERDVEARDAYGRMLAYVYRAADGLFVNRDLVEEGYARLLTYRPNVAHLPELTAAVDDASQAGAGLWSACAPARAP
jgi:micrococcal nuclease